MDLNINIKDKIAMNIKVDLDYYRRIIHVLEPMESTNEIENVIETIRETMQVNYGLENEIIWSWFLYRKSGTVSNYFNGDFFYIPLTDIRVYPAYIGEMLIRINKNRLLG